jgi:hypothetical protein
MTTMSTLAATSLIASELAACEAATPYLDGTGLLTAANQNIARAKQQLAQLAAVVPAGTNLTNINAAITALT